MHVLAGGEGLEQALVLRQVRHDAQFDLRIVRRHDHRSRRRDEGFADAAAFRGAHRYVLQVRIVARQPPGHRHRLRVVGMHAARRRVHHLRQLVGVRGLEFCQPAVLEYQLRQRMIEREFLQDIFVGGRLAARRLFLHRQALALEQDLLELLGRIEVERLPGFLMHPVFKFDHLFAQVRGSAAPAARSRAARPGVPS